MKKNIVTILLAASLVMTSTACGANSKKSTSAKVQQHNDAIVEVVESIDSYVGDGDSYSYVEYECTTIAGADMYEETVANAENAKSGEIKEQDFNTEEYNIIKENGFVNVADAPLSTFAADVDTGSYCNLRRMIRDGWDLQNISGAIRTEEMVNYFDYKVDSTDNVFSAQYSIGDCPWNDAHKLLILTMQANSEINIPDKGSNFVFLIDTSGSMNSQDKLPLVKESFKLLAATLGPNDRVSIVTYSGSSDTLLVGSNNLQEICSVIDQLEPYGGTNGSGGIEAAYECAKKNFVENGNNRVIIASDGDMNLGITSQSGLVDLIKEKKESGVFLTVLGYGYGNYSDANMESIADAGNGNYFYIDSIEEAERVLCAKLKQTTVTVAKDVKFQLEFNPAEVSSYRQIGYENRQMSASDFADDTKDGGEVGAGAQVTVCYELVLTGSGEGSGSSLKYQDTNLNEKAKTGELLTVSVRYKDPTADKSQLLEYPLKDNGISNREDFNFICGVIEASMVMRNSEYKGSATFDSAYQLAKSGANNDRFREEFCELLTKLGADH